MTEEDIELWQQVFQELIQEVKPWHKWTLTQDKDLLPGVLKPGWMQYQQKTFARFHCSCCSRSWASGCVLTIFHMHWCEKKGKGQVKMRVFAQRCNKCPEPPFAVPEFTWDNISRILNNLLFRILKKCYGEGFKQMDEIPLVGDTSLEGPHDSNNCEACLQGFCAQSGLGLASKPPECPLSPTPSKSAREPKVTTTNSSSISCAQTSSKVEKSHTSKVDPKASNPTKGDLKVSHASNPSKPHTSKVDPKASNPTKGDLKVSHASNPSKPHTSKVDPKASNPTKGDLKVSHASNPSNPQALEVDPKASTPTKGDLKVSHASNPSTPILTSQLLSPVSSPTVRCVTQMPSPIKSSRAADTGKNTRSKTPKVLPPSSSFAPPTSSSFVPTTSSSFVPTTSSSFAPPTSSSFVPPTSSSFVPPTSSSFVPPISSSFVPPTSYSFIPSTSSSFVPPTSSSFVPPTSYSFAPPTSSSFVPPSTPSYVGRPPANTTCQVGRTSHIHPPSETCCESCCESCCEACCKGFCNCISHKPCLVFLILVAIIVTLYIKYGI